MGEYIDESGTIDYLPRINPFEAGRRVMEVGMLVLGSLIGITATNIAGREMSERFDTDAHVQDYVEQEAKELGVSPDKINLKTGTGVRPAFALQEVSAVRQLPDGSYEMRITEKGSNKYTVRHELYHIADGYLDQYDGLIEDKIKYLFIEEPQATLYAATGIEL